MDKKQDRINKVIQKKTDCIKALCSEYYGQSNDLVVDYLLGVYDLLHSG